MKDKWYSGLQWIAVFGMLAAVFFGLELRTAQITALVITFILAIMVTVAGYKK